MKILFLTSPFPNFVTDLLLHGLRKLLENEVIDFPRKDSLYSGELVGFSPEGQINRPWFPPDADRIDRSDIPGKISKGYFQYIICDLRIFPQILKTLSEIPKGFVVVDGEDQPQSIPPAPYVVCQRYGDCLVNVCPVPLVGGNTPPGWLPRDLYYSQLQKCRVLLTVRGAGYDTFRFWENADCKAIHISQKMPLYIPNDFEHGVHLFRFTHLIELRKYIDQVLENRTDSNSIVQGSRAHLLRYHTTQARALYLLDKLKGIP